MPNDAAPASMITVNESTRALRKFKMLLNEERAEKLMRSLKWTTVFEVLSDLRVDTMNAPVLAAASESANHHTTRAASIFPLKTASARVTPIKVITATAMFWTFK